MAAVEAASNLDLPTGVFQRGDPGYEALRQAAVWNAVVPDRQPAAIARPARRDEVAELVRRARSRGQRIAVKSGGHNWRGACLRNEGLLLDLGALQQVEVDPEARIARAGPGATHRLLADAIVPHRLGFPIGHCPSVGLGGYLLAGGYGWNPRTWGPAAWSVRGLDVVSVDGDELFIDADSHPDLYWAARGGAAGFPAVVTRFHLDLHPLPHMTTLRTLYPIERLPELLVWSAGQRHSPAGVEVSLLAVRPPDDPSRPAVVVQATSFEADNAGSEELMRTVADDLPYPDQVLGSRDAYEVGLNTIEAAGAWVEGRRYAVDMAIVTGGYEEIGRRTVAHFTKAPSRLTRVVFAWHFFPEPAPDVAQNQGGDLSVNVYSIWDQGDPGSDASNERWTRELMAEYEPWIVGFYAGEADLLVTPDRAQRSYPSDKWTKLEAVRRRYDPDGVKFGFINEP